MPAEFVIVATVPKPGENAAFGTIRTTNPVLLAGNHNKEFTLLELLVVIAVPGLTTMIAKHRLSIADRYTITANGVGAQTGDADCLSITYHSPGQNQAALPIAGRHRTSHRSGPLQTLKLPAITCCRLA
jgi:hypothetical protein